MAFWNTGKDTYSKALEYIELYANPIQIAMGDLEKGEIKDINIISIISQIMVDESSHNLDREVSY